MKRKAPKSYGFTTKESDRFLTRIIREAKNTDRILLVQDKNAFREERTVHVLIRPAAVPPKSANLTLRGVRINSELWTPPVEGFFVRTFPLGKNHKRTVNILRAEIQRIKNWNDGRSVRVLVEQVG